MRLMLDLNILLDVIQKRHPHYDGSARILEFAFKKTAAASLPMH